MGLLDELDKVKNDLEEARQKFADKFPPNGWTANMVELGESMGKVMSFSILPTDETGFPKLEMTFTDRGIYSYNGKQIPGGTNCTFRGYMDSDLIFYGQGNGMSVATTKPTRCYSTWYVQGTAKLEPTLTGAGTYRGSMLYRWDGEMASLNGTPAIFQLVLDDFGFTFGKIWRWDTDTSS